MQAVIKLDVPEWQIGQEVTVYFPDTMQKQGVCELPKEQEAQIQNNGKCPRCGWNFEDGELEFSHLDSGKFYCPNCGQEVKWE